MCPARLPPVVPLPGTPSCPTCRPAMRQKWPGHGAHACRQPLRSHAEEPTQRTLATTQPCCPATDSSPARTEIPCRGSHVSHVLGKGEAQGSTEAQTATGAHLPAPDCLPRVNGPAQEAEEVCGKAKEHSQPCSCAVPSVAEVRSPQASVRLPGSPFRAKGTCRVSLEVTNRGSVTWGLRRTPRERSGSVQFYFKREPRSLRSSMCT